VAKEKTNFDYAFEYSLKNEGGFSNHKNDRGGATKYGITRSTLSRWIGQPASIDDVKNISEDLAKDIYKRWYWDTMRLDEVKSKPIAIAMFDIGLVRGTSIPPKYAQLVLNAQLRSELNVDGVMGPKTISAINRTLNKPFLDDYIELVVGGFRQIVAKRPQQKVFLKGWLKRAIRLKSLLDA